MPCAPQGWPVRSMRPCNPAGGGPGGPGGQGLITALLGAMKETGTDARETMAALDTSPARWSHVVAGRAAPWHPVFCQGYRPAAELLGLDHLVLSKLAMLDREAGPPNPFKGFTNKKSHAKNEIDR
jgi:hypothetical protein